MKHTGSNCRTVLPVGDILRVLLRFLQYSKAALQQQQGSSAHGSIGSSINSCSNSSTTASSSDSACQCSELHNTVMCRVRLLLLHTAEHKDDFSLQQSWLVWGHHVTQLIDQLLHRTAPAAVDDGRNSELLGASVLGAVARHSHFSYSASDDSPGKPCSEWQQLLTYAASKVPRLIRRQSSQTSS